MVDSDSQTDEGSKELMMAIQNFGLTSEEEVAMAALSAAYRLADR